ncbi:hypothetical protein ACTG2K_09485 [Aeromonas caviae]|uniref:hypothetical protein n=1 Tax=Aeromonas caviae TaxID=648 RepID=UPI001601DC93|nr:hypothetical protein [Aeromonas caviae]
MRFASTCCAALLGLSTPYAIADCWIVTNISGYGATAHDNYNFTEDKITNGVFQVAVDGDNSKVTSVGKSLSGDGLVYVEVSKNTLIGFYHDTNFTTVETWSITTDKKVLYTKIINAPDNSWTTSRSMVGDVVGHCNPAQNN